MPIVYHNERFFGALGWAAQGRSHDAALLIYEQKKTGLKLDVGLAFNQRSLDPSEPKKLTGTFYEGTDNYKNIQYLFFSKKLVNTDVTALIHNDGKQVQSDSTTAYRQALGATIDQNINNVIKVGGGEVYCQMGKDENDVDVSAFLISAYATLSTDMTPITLAIDYASGTKNGSKTNNSWTPLYGTNHKFYGWMDYFYVGNSHDNVGLVDLMMFTKFKTGDKSNFQARAHYFLSAEEVVDKAICFRLMEID